MLKKAFIGSCTFTVQGFDLDKLSNIIMSDCKIHSLTVAQDVLNVSVSFLDKDALLNIFNKNNCIYELVDETGMLRHLIRYKNRYGIFIGLLTGLLLAFLMSNIVFKTELVYTGEYQSSLSDELLDVLENEGVKTGAFIPNIDFRELEAVIYSLFDEVAWTSIGHEGSVVTVNIATVTDKLHGMRSSLPSNIVASRDGVIVDARVLMGQLDVLIGSAVTEGDLLISGVSDSRNGMTYYYHSMGEIIAEFDEEYVFTQEYLSVTQFKGKTKTIPSLKLFDMEISLWAAPKGNYAVEQSLTPIKIFGVEMPFSIIKNEYSEIVEDIIKYSEAEAEEELLRRIKILEEFTLKDYEILKKTVTKSSDHSSVSFTVKYKLKGDIGKQQTIFTK